MSVVRRSVLRNLQALHYALELRSTLVQRCNDYIDHILSVVMSRVAQVATTLTDRLKGASYQLTKPATDDGDRAALLSLCHALKDSHLPQWQSEFQEAKEDMVQLLRLDVAANCEACTQVAQWYVPHMS